MSGPAAANASKQDRIEMRGSDSFGRVFSSAFPHGTALLLLGYLLLNLVTPRKNDRGRNPQMSGGRRITCEEKQNDNVRGICFTIFPRKTARPLLPLAPMPSFVIMFVNGASPVKPWVENCAAEDAIDVRPRLLILPAQSPKLWFTTT
jgi:hypothetical protein